MRVLHGVDVALAVDPPQQAALVVVLGERLGLPVIDAQALADGVGVVVGAALAAVEDAVGDDVVRHLEQHDVAERPAAVVEQPGERVRLLDGAGEAVEQQRLVVAAGELLGEHRVDHVVGHELAAVHVLRGLRGRARCPARAPPRSRSPVESATNPSSPSRLACVPLPLPGGPSRMMVGAGDTVRRS